VRRWFIIVSLVLGITLSFFGVLFFTISKPESLWKVVRWLAVDQDVKIQWQEIVFVPEHLSGLKWRIAWHARNLVISREGTDARVQIDDASVLFTVTLLHPRTHIEVEEMILTMKSPSRWWSRESRDRRDSRGSHEDSAVEVDSILRKFRWINSHSNFQRVDLEIQDLHWGEREPSKWIMRIQKFEKGSNENRLEADVRVSGPQYSLDGKSHFHFHKMGSENAFGTGTLSGQLGKSKMELAWEALAPAGHVAITAKGPLNVAWGDRLIQTQQETRADWDGQRLQATCEANAQNLPGPFHQISGAKGSASWAKLPDGYMGKVQYQVEAPLNFALLPQNWLKAFEKTCQCQLPEQLQLKASGEYSLSKTIGLTGNIEVDGLRTPLLNTRLSAKLRAFDRGGEWIWEPQLDGQVQAPNFKMLKALMSDLQIEVPATLAQLNGWLEYSLKGLMSWNERALTIPGQIKVALASEANKINLTSDVSTNFSYDLSSLEIFAKSLIEDWQTDFPQNLFAEADDKNINTPVQLFYELKTVRPGAIKLSAPFAKPHVPLSVDMVRGEGGDLVGYIRAEPFSIEYLRRTIHVEQMRLLMGDRDNAEFPVDGRWRVDQSQYRISISISGTLKSPFVQLESEPTLERSDVFSVLLFDKTLNQLTDQEAETLTAFETAMGERAIGLFGIGAFARSPVRTFQYDPIKKVYNATLDQANGEVMQVSSAWEATMHQEVRKRVSRRWVLKVQNVGGGRLAWSWVKRP